MVTVSFDIPGWVLDADQTPEAFGSAVRLAAAMFWYDRGEVSQERGATIAGLLRADFIDALAAAEIEVGQYTLEELREELARD